jgi:hypothetical protein
VLETVTLAFSAFADSGELLASTGPKGGARAGRGGRRTDSCGQSVRERAKNGNSGERNSKGSGRPRVEMSVLVPCLRILVNR